MKILAIGDPHVSVKNIKDIKLFEQKIIEVMRSEAPDATVILGDLHNDFERVHSLAMRAMVELLTAMIAENNKVFLLVGNHCFINNSIFLEDAHAFVAVKRWGNPVVVDAPVSWNGFIFMPYTPPGRFKEGLDKTNWAEAKAIFCHQEFRGVQLGPRQSKHGDEWEQDAPLVVSGHIHQYQWLQKNVLYVGEPFDGSFGGEGDRTVSLLEFAADGKVNQKRIDLGMPRRLTVTLTIEQLKAYQKPEKAHVRVYVTGTTEELAIFKKSKEYKDLSKDLKIITKPSDILVARRNEGGLRYAEILAQSVASESEAVKEAFAEVSRCV